MTRLTLFRSSGSCTVAPSITGYSRRLSPLIIISVPLGRIHVQPLREQHVDLVDVLLERGVAGRVVLHVVGGAQAFAGVEGNFGGFAGGFAARGALVLRGAQQNRLVGQGPVIVPGNGQQQLGQVLAAQHIEDKTGHHQRGHHGCRIQNAAQALPALAFRVEKDLSVGHVFVLCRADAKTTANKLRYTVRIVWKLPKRVN